jgi:2-dehydropantoate 2-reductase
VTRVVVAGAGSIGSLLAAHLARVADVTVLTRREAHAAALREDGLTVSGRADFTARPDATADPSALPADAELAILACKGTDLEPLAEQLEGTLPRATVMTIQNGLGAEDVVGAHGDWPLLSSVTFMSGTRHGDAHVEYVLDTATWIGPYRGTTEADARRVTELIEAGGLKAQAFEDLRPAQWSKLVFNATVNGVAALTGLPHDFHFAQTEEPSGLGHLVRDLVEEGKAVAATAGVQLHDDPWEMNVLATQRGHRHYPSMLEDVEARRPTELESINGALVREALRLGVPVPLQTALYRLVKAREASYSEPGSAGRE